MAPQLLTLPRALRDEIYLYLTTTGYLRPKERYTGFPKRYQYRIKFSGAVFMPVLLVCRQIHDEYLETTLPKLSVCFYMGGGYDFSNQQQLKASSSQAKILLKIKKSEVLVNWACLVPREHHE